MQQGGRDFITGMPIDLHTYFERSVDIHHVFPRKWCEDAKLPREKWNSVVNKAPLAAKTNRSIGGDAPTHYGKTVVIETERQGALTFRLRSTPVV